MASRRLAASTVDWAEFARKIPDVQKASFLALKAKQDGYVRVINSLPEKTPAIDWSFYKNKIPVAGKQTVYFVKLLLLKLPSTFFDMKIILFDINFIFQCFS